MLKKYVVVSLDEKPIFVCAVKDSDTGSFIRDKKEAEKNLSDLLKSYDDKFAFLEKRVEELEKQVKVLKGEE